MNIEKRLPDWLSVTEIDFLCTKINNTLANNIELRDRFFEKEKWDLCYMNFDLISHSENIYEYFINLDDEVFEKNSSIYIYGLLQSIFTQQDAIVQLEKLFSKELSFGFFCEKYFEFEEKENEINPIKVIRWHRNNLVGHPTTRNVDKISKFEIMLNKKYFPNSKHNTDNNEKRWEKVIRNFSF